MPIGKNISFKDKLIKKTMGKASKTGMPSPDPRTSTYKTKKMTFYVKEDLLEKLYNFSYWDRHTITEAINIALEDGLKGKNTKRKGDK